MRRFLTIIAAVAAAVCLSSCDSEIANPVEEDFIGTWDLANSVITYSDGSVTTFNAPAGKYIIFTESTISHYEDDKIVEHGKFKYQDGNIYVDGTIRYKVESMSRKQMTLVQNGLGLLVVDYKFVYNKR